jgi:hypothetical protein
LTAYDPAGGRVVTEDLAGLRTKFVEADRKHAHSSQYEDWLAWQQLGADYFVTRYPASARYRNLDPQRSPGVEELRALAEELNQARDGVPSGWRIGAWDDQRIEHSSRVAWFHELMAGLYAPVEIALSDLRRGDTSRLETLIRFLEADPYCHRSGDMKADIINAITRVTIGDRDRNRLRNVLLDLLHKPAKREFRQYVRLAKYLDDPELRAALTERVQSADQPAARQAGWILTAL